MTTPTSGVSFGFVLMGVWTYYGVAAMCSMLVLFIVRRKAKRDFRQRVVAAAS
jgi:uncharacterized membrane protein YdjX (TVP38/TMEM64 family)